MHAGPFAARIRACKRTSRGGPDDADAVRFVEETTFAGPDGRMNLTLLFRADDGFADRLLGLLEQLSHTGFGAGVSSGWGQFDLPEDPRPADELDEPPAGVNGVIALSTFQPSPDDPATGDWDAFVKEPRVGPEGGLGGEAGRKRPVVLFRPPRACFAPAPQRLIMGRAIPMHEILSTQAAREQRARGIELTHPAFALRYPRQCVV